MRTPDRELASVGDRFVAHFIDAFASTVVIIIAAVILASSENSGGIVTLLGKLVGYIGIFAGIFYRFCADGLENGQSYGKRVMGICVVDATSGKPCTYMKSLSRQVSLGVLGIIDWAFIFSEKRQRVGDLIANTIVVNKKSRLNTYQG